MTRQQFSSAGLVGLVTGLLGVLSALVMLAWPAQSPPEQVSYPFTIGGYVAAQVWFFVHHWGLVVVLAALALSPAIGSGRLARLAAWVAVAGMVMLSGAELLSIRYAAWSNEVANAGLMGTAYGVACTVIGLGLVAAGIGVVRAGVWSGWHRWIPLAAGVAVFAVVTPAMFGGFVIARLGIGFWMLLFAGLGWSMHQHAQRSAAGRLAQTRNYDTLRMGPA
jgi:hypothetical protein